MASTKTIMLKATDGTTVGVHKDLLVFFSKYYEPALDGYFPQAAQTIFDVDLSRENLQRFKTWLHTGELAEPEHQEGICDCENHVRLYIFADVVDILALRREVMNYMTAVRAPLPDWGPVRAIFSKLPQNSPLRRLVLRLFIAHWTPEDDSEDEYSEAV